MHPISVIQVSFGIFIPISIYKKSIIYAYVVFVTYIFKLIYICIQ